MPQTVSCSTVADSGAQTGGAIVPLKRRFKVTAKRTLNQAKALGRAGIRLVQICVWKSEKLTAARVQGILGAWDPNTNAGEQFTSESHQVFRVLFKQQPCVAKFAGQAFVWKFVLQAEVARMHQLAAAGLPVPPVLLDRSERWQNPFFLMPYLASQSKHDWTDHIRQASWATEAEIIQRVPSIVVNCQLPFKSVQQSRGDADKEIATVQLDLEKLRVNTPAFRTAMECYRETLRSRAWVIGPLQPPELVFDGTRFWVIDWDAFRFIHPLKWINDYSFFDIVRDPPKGRNHLHGLLAALGFDPADPVIQSDILTMQRFKALSVGTYLINKSQRWSYFETLKQRFF